MGLQNQSCPWDAAYERIVQTNHKNPSNPMNPSSDKVPLLPFTQTNLIPFLLSRTDDGCFSQ